MSEYRAYVALLVMAVLPILAGAHHSLRMPKAARKRLRLHQGVKQSKEQQEEEDEDDELIDRLTAADAYAFPILGSVVLFSLYLAFTYLPKVWINRIVGGYMSIMGVAATARTAVAAAKLLPESRWKGLTQWKLTLHRNKVQVEYLSANTLQLAMIPFSVALAVLQHYRPHWIVSNVLALSFAFNAISLLRLDSFFTGSVLLALLFFYDIWWVFGSKAVFGADVMVKVATNLEAPIKVTFPRNLAAATGFSFLGLGDIVLPGIFVALTLRYDYHRALKANPPPKPSSTFPRPYFWSVMGAYVAGLVATVTVMHTFKAAQPALLYLSPACILSVVLCAVLRGELGDLWAFDDASDDNDTRSKALEKKQKSNNDGVVNDKGAVNDEETEIPLEEKDVAESTSIEIEGQRVLRSRVVKQ